MCVAPSRRWFLRHGGCLCPPACVWVLTCYSVCGLTAGPEPLSRATVRAGLRAGVTGAAGRTGASTATVTGWPGNQFLHSLPQQPRLCYTVEPTGTVSRNGQRGSHRWDRSSAAAPVTWLSHSFYASSSWFGLMFSVFIMKYFRIFSKYASIVLRNKKINVSWPLQRQAVLWDDLWCRHRNCMLSTHSYTSK